MGSLFGARQPQIERYAELLATSGLERGLIGPREVPRLWDRHILNCAVVEELIPPGVSVADVGSGAGLPGLVIAIARPDLTVSLVEPLLRRVTWLREVVAELELANVELVRGRAEQVAPSGARFEVVTARAVAALPALAEFCLPLLLAGGVLLALKGESAERELAEARPLLAKAGVLESTVRRCGEAVLQSPTTVVEIRAGSRPGPLPATGKTRSKGRRR